MFSLNLSGDPEVNLVGIIIVVFSLLLIKGLLGGRVYKSSYIDTSEMVCYTNLCVLCVIKLKYKDNRIVDITTHLSGIITYMLLIVVIFYHIYTTFISKCLKNCSLTESQLSNSELTSNAATNSLSTESFHREPTTSVVQLTLPGSCKHHSVIDKRNVAVDDDNISLNSADSDSPLLES